MPLNNAVVNHSNPSRVQALKAKHKNISKQIETEQSRPFIYDHVLAELKREKLKLKEQIEGIRDAS